MKIIMDWSDGDIDAEMAMDRVADVIREGRVSEAGGIHHFCWVTVFKDGLTVAVRRKRKPDSPDSFSIYFP